MLIRDVLSCATPDEVTLSTGGVATMSNEDRQVHLPELSAYEFLKEAFARYREVTRLRLRGL